MTLSVNSNSVELHDRCTVQDLLRQLGLDQSPCAVELNRRLVPKAEHPTTPLRDGDDVEVVTLVGGG